MPVLHDEPGMFVPYLTKEEWGGKPPSETALEQMRTLEKPVPYVRYTYTRSERCDTTEHCTQQLRFLQLQDIQDEKLADLRYNFAVGGDGKVYVGRGWDYDAERPEEYNKLKGKCIDVAYFGNYSNEHPPWDMLKAGLDILKIGLREKHISPTFEIIPYRDDGIEAKVD